MGAQVTVQAKKEKEEEAGDAGRMQGRERTWWVVDGDARGYC